ncbi:hypothetical protein [Nocardia suismassiliense]|uniref:hypothetical protein n=1 Tax=Nocardia suismassiliense TaxID=2077092 RepID=UPI000D1E191A|nr:hypothetical protein [Nocardia suismassiliense]
MNQNTQVTVLPDWHQLQAACWNALSENAHPVARAAAQLAEIIRAEQDPASTTTSALLRRELLIAEINAWVNDHVAGLNTLGATVDRFTQLGVAAHAYLHGDNRGAVDLNLEKLANAWTQVVAEVEKARMARTPHPQRQTVATS